MNVITAHLHQRAIPLFPYLDDWLIRDLIRGRFISQTIYCLQTVQSLGFIPNLKKSDLKPAQQFTFIGMEFLTQQNIVRVQPGCMESLLLTIKQFLTRTQVSAQTFLSLLGKLSAAADLVVLGRLHLRLLQISLLSVWRPRILPLGYQVLITSMVWLHLKWWMDTIASLTEHSSILQIPMHSFLQMPAIMDGELILNRWDYPFMVTGRKTNPSFISTF